MLHTLQARVFCGVAGALEEEEKKNVEFRAENKPINWAVNDGRGRCYLDLTIFTFLLENRGGKAESWGGNETIYLKNDNVFFFFFGVVSYFISKFGQFVDTKSGYVVVLLKRSRKWADLEWEGRGGGDGAKGCARILKRSRDSDGNENKEVGGRGKKEK